MGAPKLGRIDGVGFGTLSESGYGRWADYPAERSLSWWTDTSVTCAVTAEMLDQPAPQQCKSSSVAQGPALAFPIILLLLAIAGLVYDRLARRGGRLGGVTCGTQTQQAQSDGGVGGTEAMAGDAIVAAAAPPSTPPRHGTGRDSVREVKVLQLEEALSRERIRVGRLETRLGEFEEKEKRWAAKEEEDREDRAKRREERRIASSAESSPQKQMELRELQQKVEVLQQQRVEAEARDRTQGERILKLEEQLMLAREEAETQLRLAREDTVALCSLEQELRMAAERECEKVKAELQSGARGEHRNGESVQEQQIRADAKAREALLEREAEEREQVLARRLEDRQEEHKKEVERQEREHEACVKRLEEQHKLAREELEVQVKLARGAAEPADWHLSPLSIARATPSPLPASASACASSSSPPDRSAWASEALAAHGAEGPPVHGAHGAGDAAWERTSLLSEAGTSHAHATVAELESRLREARMRLEAAEGEREALRGVLGASEARAEETEKLVKYQRGRLQVLEQRLSVSPASARGSGAPTKDTDRPSPDTVEEGAHPGEPPKGGGSSKSARQGVACSSGSILNPPSWAKAHPR